MLITVTGASDHGGVVGLRSGDHQGLLRLGRPAVEPMLVLTPRHLVLEAREQAHVLVAAHPNAQVCVLPLDHHALTLVLIAEALAASPAAGEGWPDPSEAVQLAQRYAARSESLVWYRTMWGLEEPTPTAGQLTAGLFRRSGYIRELAADPAVIPARPGSPVALGVTVHHVEGAPALLGQQLGEVDLVPVGVTVEPGPYSNRSSVELTLLAGSDARSTRDHHCGSCGAGLVAGHCPFCGHGPWVAAPAPNHPGSNHPAPNHPAPNRPDRQQATTAADAVVVPLPSAPVPVGAGGPNSSEGSPT